MAKKSEKFEHSNAIVRWTVAQSRLDGIDILIYRISALRNTIAQYPSCTRTAKKYTLSKHWGSHRYEFKIALRKHSSNEFLACMKSIFILKVPDFFTADKAHDSQSRSHHRVRDVLFPLTNVLFSFTMYFIFY